jgi:trehalose 6-phosphate phosphatase
VLEDALAELRARLDRCLIALDFDGTLAPIVPDPATSRPESGVVDALTALSAAGAQVAIITGREAVTVVELGGFAGVPGLIVAGIYGAQWWQDGTLIAVDEPASMRLLRRRLPDVVAENCDDPDVWIEDKRLSLVVHTRVSADPEGEQDRLIGPITDLADDLHLIAEPGRQVVEVRLPGFDKGTVLQDLAGRSDDDTAVLFAGDDVGDLPAFKLVERWRAEGRLAVSVAVASDDVPDVRDAATGHVTSTAELAELLRRLTD